MAACGHAAAAAGPGPIRGHAPPTLPLNPALDPSSHIPRPAACPPPLFSFVQDTICTKGLRTTAASRMLADHVPAYDATAVARLRRAGAVVVGKTNCDAFAMGSTGEASAAGPTANPWAPGRVPGGSSGGSAAAVAARQVPAALGSDTGGSIRQPASFCGCVGIKPTYGRVPRHGLIAYGSSLDCIGPLAATVEDAALVLDVISGRDGRDATSGEGTGGSQPLVPPGGLPSAAALGPTPLAGLRAGIISQTVAGPGLAPGVAAAFTRAVDHLQALGADVQTVSLPSFAAALPAYYIIATAEASSNLARFDGLRLPKPAGLGGAAAAAAPADVKAAMAAARAAGFPDEVKRRILMGTYVLSAGYVDAYYARAQRVRTLIQREMGGALRGGGGGGEEPSTSSDGKFDVLLAPAAPTTAYAAGAGAADPLAMYLGDVMTVPLNLAGLPGVCVPAGFDDGGEGGGAGGHDAPPPLPVGLQVIAGAWGEAGAVRVAHAFEVTAPFARRGWAPLAAK